MTTTASSTMQQPAELALRDESQRDREAVDRIATADLASQLQASGVPATTAAPLLELQARARRDEYGAAYPDARHTVIECAGTIVGLLVLDESHDRVRVIDLAVAPEHRRSGIARRVLSQVCVDADARAASVALQVWVTNEPALRLYESLGFVHDPEHEHDADAMRASIVRPAPSERCAP